MEYVAGFVLVQHLLKKSRENGTGSPDQGKRRERLRLFRWLGFR